MTSNNRFENTRKFQDEETATNSEVDYAPLIAVGGFLVLGGLGARAFIRQAKKLGEESAKDLKKTQEAFEKSRQNFKNPFTVKSDSTSASGTNGGAKIDIKFKTINLKDKVDDEQIKKDLEKMLKNTPIWGGQALCVSGPVLTSAASACRWSECPCPSPCSAAKLASCQFW